MRERVTVKCRFHIARRGRRTELHEGAQTPLHDASSTLVRRISRLMAIAIRFDDLISSGAVSNMAELAALGHVTRARVTQIMNLLNLAPDIQDELLHLHSTARGRAKITEREIRTVATISSWSRQRDRWQRMWRTSPTQTKLHGNKSMLTCHNAQHPT